MSPNQQNLLELAKQGDTKAIAILVNRSLQPKGITAKVNLKNSCLQILVESDNLPDQELVTQLLVSGIKKLNPESIKSIKIFGRKNGEDIPEWTRNIVLRSSPKKTNEKELSLVSNPLISNKPQSSKIPSSVDSEKSKLGSAAQNPEDNAKDDIWTKSKSVTISALKSAWQWYISGFKSRPDLPLYLSPRLYRILLTFFAFVWITAPFGAYNEESFDSPSSSSERSSSANQNLKSLCAQDDKGNPKHIIQVDNTRFEITKLDADYYQVLGVENTRLGSDADFAYTIGIRDQINYYGGYPRPAPDDMDELEEVDAWFVSIGRTCTNR